MHILKYLTIFSISLTFNLALLANDDYLIQTSSGISIGIPKKGVVTWNDIPYAKPPIKELRWMAPRDINQPDKKLADIDNNFCVQSASSLGGVQSETAIVGQEDCLFLDIRAPINNNNLLPVMFWIHGGGNTSGLKDLYDFSGLVKTQNLIVVSINYRSVSYTHLTLPTICSV